MSCALLPPPAPCRETGAEKIPGVGTMLCDPPGKLTTSVYALGPAALPIGLAALHQLDPIQGAPPVAEALAARTGHAVALAVWAADDALFAGLATSAEFLTLLRRTVAELEQWIKQPESQLAAV